MGIIEKEDEKHELSSKCLKNMRLPSLKQKFYIFAHGNQNVKVHLNHFFFFPLR